MNVGSTCITNFRDIKGVNGKSKEEIDKEWEKQQRQNALNDRYNGIIDKIENWKQKIDEIPTIVNGKLEKEYDEVYSEVQELYQKFIKNKKLNYSIADKINKLVCQGEEILQRIYEDVNKRKNDEWYITKEIKEWCLKNREENNIVIQFLKEDGLIKWRSACRIREKSFINKVLQKLKISLSDSNIQIMGFNEVNNSITINIKDNNPYTDRINLSCSYSKFMYEYGYTIFEKNDKFIDARKFVIQNSEILEDSSLGTSIHNIRFLLNRSKRKIYEWEVWYNEIVFFDDDANYLIVELKQFINVFKEYVFLKKLNPNQIEKINNYVKKYGRKINKKEYEDRLEMREKADKATQVDYSKFV